MEHEIEIIELKAKVQKLIEECCVLKDQLARFGSLGDEKKEKLLRKIIESYPDCYSRIEFDDAFDEAAKQ